MPSAFPFTKSFLTEAVEKLKKTELKDKFDELEALRQAIIKKYTDWAEKKLKGCPDFVRRFAKTITFPYVDYNDYGQMVKGYQSIRLDGARVPVVPGYLYNGDALGSGCGAEQMFRKYYELKKKLSVIKACECDRKQKYFYGEGLGAIELKPANGAKGRTVYELTGLTEYREFFQKLIPGYEQSVRDSVHELITGKRPEIAKKETPTEPVQLEFQF